MALNTKRTLLDINLTSKNIIQSVCLYLDTKLYNRINDHSRNLNHCCRWHYNDVIMSTMASQITSLTIVYPIVYSGVDQRKKSKLHVTCLWAGNSPVACEFPAQRANNAENVSIWWRHHDLQECVHVVYLPYLLQKSTQVKNPLSSCSKSFGLRLITTIQW